MTATLKVEPEVRQKLKEKYVTEGYSSYSDYLKNEVLND